MLHVIILILKTIGILLGSILALLLLLLFLGLFVPVRYQSSGSYYGQPKASGVISWLFHIIHITLHYDTAGFQFEIRIFGFRKGKRRESKRKVKRQVKNAVKKGVVNTAKEVTEPSPKAQLEERERKAREIRDESRIEATKGLEESSGKEKVSLLKRLFLKIKLFYEKVKYTFELIYGKLKDIRNSFRSFWRFIHDEENKEAFHLIKEQFFVILKHIKPRQFQLKLHFGFDDPSKTGMALGLLSVLYPIYKTKVGLYADFENQVLEGSYRMKGRIRGILIVKVIWRLYFHKPTRRLLGRFIG